MKKLLLITSFLSFAASSKAQTVVCPNGDMESVNICFVNGAVFSFWNDYGCTDAYVNPTPVANSGFSAMLITNDNSLSAPVAWQDFSLGGAAFPTCMTFAAKIDLNAGDTVKVKAYINCNGNWLNTATWHYTNPNAVSLPYTQYQFNIGTAILCLTGMDSMRIELIGGKVMSGNTPTSFYVDDIVLDCATGIADVAAANDLQLFPVPASGELNVVLKNNAEKITAVKIWSVTGELVYSGQGNATGKIDVSMLSAGSYFAEVTSGTAVYRKKLEILH